MYSSSIFSHFLLKKTMMSGVHKKYFLWFIYILGLVNVRYNCDKFCQCKSASSPFVSSLNVFHFPLIFFCYELMFSDQRVGEKRFSSSLRLTIIMVLNNFAIRGVNENWARVPRVKLFCSYYFIALKIRLWKKYWDLWDVLDSLSRHSIWLQTYLIIHSNVKYICKYEN